jgi:hypothetical protein
MTDYENYNKARQAIVNMVENKEKEIDRLEYERTLARKTLRLLDESFNQECKQKPKEIG